MSGAKPSRKIAPRKPTGKGTLDPDAWAQAAEPSAGKESTEPGRRRPGRPATGREPLTIRIDPDVNARLRQFRLTRANARGDLPSLSDLIEKAVSEMLDRDFTK